MAFPDTSSLLDAFLSAIFIRMRLFCLQLDPGSFLLTVGLLCLQLCSGAFLLTIGALCLQLELVYL